MPHYRAYGLSIHSDLEFPELLQCPQAEADLTIQQAEIPPLPGPQEVRCLTEATTARMLYPDVALLQASHGNQLTYHRLGPAEDHLRLFLLGCGLAMICEQRGRLALHAAAVTKGPETVLLCGTRGAGKSTTTAALLNRGWKPLSDDVTPLDGLLAPPAFPYLRLWPASLDLLGSAVEDHPRLLSDQQKRRVVTTLETEPRPVTLVVCLQQAPALAVQKLKPAAAVMTLVTHSFNAAWRSEGFPPAMAAANFQLCSKLAKSVPVYSLGRPLIEEQLHSFLDALEALASS